MSVIQTSSSNLKSTLIKLILPISIVTYWFLATKYNWIDTKLWASPERISKIWDKLLLDGFLYKAIWGSLTRDIYGAALGIGAGIIVGSLLGLFKTAEYIGAPLLNFLKNVAIFAWIPLISMVFGIGELSKVVFIALGAFYPVVFNTFEGFRSARQIHLELADVYGFSSWQKLRKIVFPAALPSIITGVQIALILAWVATVGAEFFMTSGYSIGGILIEGSQRLLLEEVFVGIALLGGIGYAFHLASEWLAHSLLKNRAAR